ncbi:hypothetical protein [Maricaulis sp.]|uniref:hypothetical protein n=1 Tax=Maricaulis sp. TaxID=1486257 RepID=UPI0025F5B49B|nr:hypothetical protein [Maricaulis sp.]MDF1769944.1 hypothetical protein [Maricaulis sp.]
MSGDVHYEIFFKKNRKAGWTLSEALEDRDKAIKLATAMIAKNKDSSVRVTKETFKSDHRKFRSVAVFEGGAETMGAEVEKTGEAHLPCLTPDDLSKPHARDTIRRVLTGWLERMQAIPMELLHRPDLVESLEASGTELQHAVQKVAIASASDSDAGVHGYVKQLNELVQKSLARIYKDGRDQRLPDYPAKANFADIAGDIHKRDPRAYTLRAAMADRLRHEKKFGDKLEVLLDMADSMPAEDSARSFALDEVDHYIAEVIAFDAGRDALLGKCKDLGETLERLSCLFDGDHSADALNLAPSAAKRLARKIHGKEFPACRATIAGCILKDLERPKRLRPSSVRDEVRLARDLASRLVICADSTLPADALIKAFGSRSARLLQPEIIDELLRHSRGADEDLDRLIALEENLVGESNKQKLAGYIRSTLGSNQADAWYVRGDAKPLERLAKLTAQQAKVLKGGYPERDKLELAAGFDAMGMKVVDDSKVLNMVEGGDRPALDKATGLLRLATGGALPIGKCSADAQARALRHLKSAVGLSEAQAADGRPKLRQIQGMLQELTIMQTKTG